MDSRVVNRCIRERVWASLKESGFAKRTARTAWRQRHNQIDVINFQSFNSYLAESLGCTTFSFSVNLGTWLMYVPDLTGTLKVKDGRPLPEEYECPFRTQLRKRVHQQEYPRDDVWFVAPDGSNVDQVVGDAATVIEQEGLPWFEQFVDARSVMRLLDQPEELDGGTWGMGRNPSPMRSYIKAYTAIHLRDYETAREELRAVIQSGAFTHDRKALERELKALEGTE